ncbi:ABC transporter substrate-binding protein [Microlunatus elymi]|uniref:ABC transporter substrate-binding protein n=1 Tax=Microlunatus elymi TaxID=2596828 RepID=A0A516Q1R6_9ACTN|nr:ABC transporter substrate-binding protein [Microlunatus elymi]QDP97367.1 ABC transporter substrate-binding protein [Microlunatus elymi]
MHRRTRRLLGLTAAGLAITLTVAACGGSNNKPTGETSSGQQPVRGGTLNMLGSGDVTYMDPNISYYTVDNQVNRLFSRGLFAYPAIPGKITSPAPDLVTDLPTTDNGGISSDGKTYTLKIRQGATWNTDPARQVTAQDAVRGLKRTCNPAQPFGGIPDFHDLIVGYAGFCDGFAKVDAKSASAMAKYLEDHQISGATATDDQTLVFKLTHPATYFVDMLTMDAFNPAPKEIDQYVPASAQQAQHTVSDGPYQVATYDPTKQIVLTRNPSWKADSDPIRKAYVDKVVINETVSQDSTQQQLQTGSADADMEFDNAPPPSQLPQLIAAKDPNLNLGITASSNPYIVFNMVSPNNSDALKNLKVRQAMEYALNRTDMIQVLGGPKVNPPLTNVLPPGIDGAKAFNPYGYDVNKAKQLLQEAGVSNLTLKFLYRNDSEGQQKVFQVAQQDMSKIGVKVVGVPSPKADFYNKYLTVPSVAQRGVWDMAIAGWGPDWYGNAALSYFAPLFYGKSAYPPVGSNFGFYNDAQTNKLITQAQSATSKDQALSLWQQADQRVMSQAPFFPITSALWPTYHASQVHNAVYLPYMQGIDPANVWLSKDKQGG